jgi:hypothetical protein
MDLPGMYTMTLHTRLPGTYTVSLDTRLPGTYTLILFEDRPVMSVLESWLGSGLGERSAMAKIYNAGAARHVHQEYYIPSSYRVHKLSVTLTSMHTVPAASLCYVSDEFDYFSC